VRVHERVRRRGGALERAPRRLEVRASVRSWNSASAVAIAPVAQRIEISLARSDTAP
jgi:hypothetical protein